MVQAVRIHAAGDSGALVWETVEVGPPGPGEVRLKQRAIGVNYIDVYHRSGLYKLSTLPAVIGMEGAGEVVAVGAGVTDLKVGDRVAYQGVLGGYAEERLIAADRLVKLPDAISYETAAAMTLRGMTVRALLREVYRIGPETVMLFHAAAGGVGLIACQWAKALGATLIGTAGSDDKGKLALEHGAAHVINYRRENFVERVREITGGKGVDVVYDFDRQGYVPGLSRLPQAARDDGELRQCVRPRAAVRADATQGVSLRNAAVCHGVYVDAQGADRKRGRPVRHGLARPDQDQRQSHLCIEGRGAGARDLEGRTTTGSIGCSPSKLHGR